MNEKEYEKSIKMHRMGLRSLERNMNKLRPEPKIDDSIPLRRRIPFINARQKRIERNQREYKMMCWMQHFFFLYDNDKEWREYVRDLSIDYVIDPTAAP